MGRVYVGSWDLVFQAMMVPRVGVEPTRRLRGSGF